MFKENGYVVIDLDLRDALLVIRRDIMSTFDVVRRSTSGNEVRTDKDIIDFHFENQLMQFQGVRLCGALPSLFAIGNHPRILSALKDIGLEQPILDQQPQLRCDMPIDKQRIFLRHQDYTYNLGSDNSVTVWIPLQDTPIDAGALQVEPGSHTKGIFPSENGIIIDGFDFEFEQCPVSFGHALIFDQKLVHESGINKSGAIRFSIQLRYSDLKDENYASRKWPRNHISQPKGFAGPSVSMQSIKES